MALVFLDRSPQFPPVSQAEPDGLLAIGGDLSPQRLLAAYRQGIFPWYEDEPILWWSPDPRFVLFPAELKISRSMRPVLNGNRFRFSINEAFSQVMKHCRQVKRTGQRGSWINEEMIRSYTQLHEMGYAFSAEAWEADQLAGGLYGLRIGKVFCGESMFSHTSNASKFAFINWVKFLQKEGVQLIDCQVYTEHLESLGARMIPRSAFLQNLEAR
ncbi:leucyl/phenylalanyl-tRNA--protein transferase [Flavihumibacter solisilvae]|uniref:Leucyl/phenylalanyl-tRNA--protein transferase n=1 Tax=Flavihumibacter solisilvae TaxID=1349421 RepID=A0A0C1IQH0_9BACT|nr:leucyl/phenylalanyl-tRNA--protein transferase [Flavihumibacter solisilvae]KIC92724.1 leucyl/phenylalanyl-tRNA--protein transferase [Flavihumibacter solisilvae]